MDIFDKVARGTACEVDGKWYVYIGRTPESRFMLHAGDGSMLMLPDPETGLPLYPTLEMMRDLLRSRRLVLRSDPLESTVREEARRQEASKGEVEKRDPWSVLRDMVTAAWDADHCALSDRRLSEWFDRTFDLTAVIEQFGRKPSPSSMRTWIKERGRRHDRRWADMESKTGRVSRRRKIDKHVLAIIKWYALDLWLNPGRKKTVLYKRAEQDVERYNKGEPLELHNYVQVFEKPKQPVQMPSRQTFYIECELARNSEAVAAKWGKDAARSRWRGGGHAKEPTRYMEVVEQDDTPIPQYFVIDPINRVPVGQPTLVSSMCIFTRAFVGWDVSFDPPSHATWMRAVAHIGEPKQIPERFKDFTVLQDICGRPQMILYDNALQNISAAVEDAGGDVCQEVRLAGEGEATHKAHIERAHQTVLTYLVNELPGASWDIPLMREYGYDPEKHVIVTIEQFRYLLIEAFATYHLQASDALNGRCPADVWQEQMNLHGHDMVRDHDEYIRSIGDVDWVYLTKAGVNLNYLDYSDTILTEQLMNDCAVTTPAMRKTKNPSFRVKVKSNPDNVGEVYVFNPRTKRYVTLPCTKRRYAKDMPLWLHRRIRDHAQKQGLAFITESQMKEARVGLTRVIEDILPEAKMKERKAKARLLDKPAVQHFLGDTVKVLRIGPSPSGMETQVLHDLRTESRRDWQTKPQRRRRGEEKEHRDVRDAGQVRTPERRQQTPDVSVAVNDGAAGRSQGRTQPTKPTRSPGWEPFN